MTLQSSTLLLVMLIELILLVTRIAAIVQPEPWCPKTCGDLNISFPFGTRPECYLDDTFLITCNNSEPFLRKSNIIVRNVSLVDGQMTVLSSVAKGCYDASGAIIVEPNSPSFSLNTFSISSTANSFIVVGCNTYATVGDSEENDFSVGCISLCNSLNSVKNGTCSGIGCCQASIPDGVRDYNIELANLSSSSRVHAFNPCSYAFVAKKDYFNFSIANLTDRGNTPRKVPMVLDYAVGKSNCTDAKKDDSNYACRSVNSTCIDSPSGQGYFCNCSSGFKGNPYLKGGCQDIKECENSKLCKGKCEELEGSYRCYCPDGFEGDGESEVCRPSSQFKGNTLLYAALGVVSTLLLLLMGSSWIYRVARQRNLSKIRENFFRKNGGLLLKEKISKQTGCTNRALIFTEEDLKKATDNFSEATVIGKGGFGTVHKGVISDGRVVAIKKSKGTNQSQNEQFINEVIILSEVNHRNVVQLIGCCLETEIPLLVYEFITNGTLYSHIHDEFLSSNFTWDIRLKVAAETADALAYLHSAASVPIIHRDVKSVNILLHKNYNAKVADFGASRFIPLDKTEVTTLVQGTFGYLDPEYFHSSQLTDKSDVYSFGVVLAELITGEEAVSFDKSEKERNLAMYFLSSVNQNKLLEILDGRLGVLDRKVEQVQEVALLAKQCLNVKAEERPTMKEVAMELQGIKAWRQHPWTENNMNPEETEYLLSINVCSSSVNHLVGSSKGCNATGAFDSLNVEKIAHLNDGR